MKNIFTPVMILFFGPAMFSQTAYHQAVYLSKIDSALIYNIISEGRLVGDDKEISKDEELQLRLLHHFLTKDVFITDTTVLQPVNHRYSAEEIVEFPLDTAVVPLNLEIALSTINRLLPELGKKGLGFGAGIITSIIPAFISGLSFTPQQQTNFYDSLTKYVAGQFKAGVTTSYIQLFETYLSRIGELQLIFPETFDLVKQHDPLRFPDFGDTWKTTIAKDLENIPGNLVHYFEDPSRSKIKSFLFLDTALVNKIKLTDGYQFFKLGFDISDKLIHRYHPVDLINYLDVKYSTNPDFFKHNALKKIGSTFHALNVIQSNLRDTSKVINGQFDNVWIGFEQFNRLTSREIKIFIGLIYQQDRSFWSKEVLTFRNDNDRLRSFVNDKFLPIHELLLNVQEFARETDGYQKNYRDYSTFFLKLIKAVDRLGNHNQRINQDALSLIENTLDIFVSIQEKSYDNIIPNLVKSIEIIALSEKDDNKFDNEKFIKIMNGLDKFGNFCVGIVNSDNSDDLKGVISQFAANPDTYLNKRKAIVGLSLNSHPGWVLPSYDFSKEYVSTGITLPIGLELFGGNKTSKLKSEQIIQEGRFVHKDEVKEFTGHSVGLFLQFIDLGAILDYRITNDTTSLPDNINFGDILSPGASLNFSLSKASPINLSVGYQWTPKLRKIEGELEDRGHRIFLRLAWDIPLLNIFATKPERVTINQ